MELSLDSPIRFVSKVGPMMSQRLKKLDILTVRDLLFYAPFRYDDFSLISKISQVAPDQTVTIRGEIISFDNVYTKSGKKLQEAAIADTSGKIRAVWFNQPFLSRILKPGAQVRLSGKIQWFGNKIILSSPVYELVSDNPAESLHTGRLVPIYPETEGVSSKWLRGRINFLLNEVLKQVADVLPNQIISTNNLLSIGESLRLIHFPKGESDYEKAKHRLAFEELFLLHCRSLWQKNLWAKTHQAHQLSIDPADISSFESSLPFTLTHDQKEAIRAISSDLAKSVPMNRLLEGDVGSGKTVVAAAAMYLAYRNGLTSFFMAPTEILATQHFQTISKFLTPLGIKVGLITGSNKTKEPADVLVGTHALLSLANDDRLGLVIIDEQQKFGVAQRTALTDNGTKRKSPHFLTMTATPIPRTVARVMFGQVDLSTLNEMPARPAGGPAGRKKVKTWVVPSDKRANAHVWITKELTKNHGQIFVVCPLIEESETLTDVKAVKAEFERLKKIFPKFKLGLLHGRLKSKEKEKILHDLQAGKIDILVTTPVVEVGIDIPNAMIMLIEAADRFGLASLHQLRGRVGRGDIPSYCLLFTESQEEKTLIRLKAMETHFSGPELAEIDLSLRGPGEIFGTRQHGIPVLKFASFTDKALIEQTQIAAKTIWQQSHGLTNFPLLRERLEKGTITTQD